MLTCNIDRRGRRVRLTWGLVNLLAGLVVAALWAIPIGGALPWTLAIILLLIGLVGVFQAWRGWCVARALGFRTPV